MHATYASPASPCLTQDDDGPLAWQINEHLKSLEPHLTLWTTALNFQRSFPTWMEGPFLELSPEQVELDVGNWWRTLYKLGKNLVGLDNPLKVVAHVKEKLDEFKSHLPLILAMLNPGMRERHWKMLTEKVGHSVQPNEMSTLASMLDTKVEDHLAVIQDASDMASKVHSPSRALTSSSLISHATLAICAGTLPREVSG